jgi:hypothetical protein
MPASPLEDGSPRMVSLIRKDKEIAIDADDAEDAARKVAILVLQQEGGLRIGDAVRISRIRREGEAERGGPRASFHRHLTSGAVRDTSRCQA